MGVLARAMGARLGADVSGVRLHAGAGECDPSSREGQKLLAHDGDAAEVEADRVADALVDGVGPVTVRETRALQTVHAKKKQVASVTAATPTAEPAPTIAKKAPTPGNLHQIVDLAMSAAKRLIDAVESFAAAARDLNDGAVTTAGTRATLAYVGFEAEVTTARALFPHVLTLAPDATSEVIAEYSAAMKAYQVLTPAEAEVRSQIGKLGPLILGQAGMSHTDKPGEPIAWIERQTQRTAALVRKAKVILANQYDNDATAEQLNSTEDLAEQKFLEIVLKEKGFKATQKVAAATKEHREDMKIQNVMAGQAPELSKEQLTDLYEKAKIIDQAIKDGDGASSRRQIKPLIMGVEGPARSALVAAVDEKDALNRILRSDDKELVAAVQDTNWAHGQTYDPDLEDHGGMGIVEVFTSGKVVTDWNWSQAGKTVLSSGAYIGGGMVRGLGDLPVVGDAIKPVTDKVANGFDRVGGAIDHATGLDKEETEEQKRWRTGILHATGRVEDTVAEMALGDEEAAVGVLQDAKEVKDAVKTLERIEGFAETLDKAKHVIQNVMGFLDAAPEILRGLTGDRSAAIKALSDLLDMGIDALGEYLGAKTLGKGEAQDKKYERMQKKQENKEWRQHVVEHAEAAPSGGPAYESQRDATDDRERFDTKRAQDNQLFTLPSDGKAALEKAALAKLAEALTQALKRIKDALWKSLTTDEELGHAMLQQVPKMVGNLIEDAGDVAAEPIADELVERIDHGFIRKYLESKGLEAIPSSAYTGPLVSLVVVIEKEVFGWVAKQAEAKLAAAMGVEEKQEGEEEGGREG